jgi:hypothetical protein
MSNAPTGKGGAITGGDDCDDNAVAVNPGAMESCGNGIDDNCSAGIDEGCPLICTANVWSCAADGRTRRHCNGVGTGYILGDQQTCAYVCVGSPGACTSASNLADSDTRLTTCGAGAPALTPAAGTTLVIDNTGINCSPNCDGIGNNHIPSSAGATGTDPVTICVSLLSIPSSLTLGVSYAAARQPNAVIVIVDGDATVDGSVDFNGESIVTNPDTNGALGGRGAPGGGNGGNGAPSGATSGVAGQAAPGSGAAGGGGGEREPVESTAGGGGGGGFGGIGGDGGRGSDTGVVPPNGGVVYGSATLMPLYGGSGGGGGGDGMSGGSGSGAGGGPGGGAGGAVQLSVRGTLVVTGTITASGGQGAPESGDHGAGGGGSGGGILLEARTLTIGAATLRVDGGNGGGASSCSAGTGASAAAQNGTNGGNGSPGGGAGGGGGGGRVRLKATTLPDCPVGTSPTDACSSAAL